MIATHKMQDETFVLRQPVIRSAIHRLKFEPNSHGLDIGCGNGNITQLLAKSTAPWGHVIGLDISPDLVAYARDTAEKAGLPRQISFQLGDMKNIPFADDSFDWVWSMDCVGYAQSDSLPLIEEAVRVTKPGGVIALLAWSSQQLLPGYPALEARLNGTSAGIAPFRKENNPEQHFLRTSGWLHQLGLEAVNAQTIVSTVYAPLRDEILEGLKSLIEMRWSGIRRELSQADWLEFQRICQPDSPDYILDAPDYCGFYTYSLFQGKVPI